MDKIWLKHYPAGVPAEVAVDLYPSLVALLEESFRKYSNLPAYKFMGRTITFGQVDDLSRAFALDPGSYRAYTCYACFLASLGRLPEALAKVLA